MAGQVAVPLARRDSWARLQDGQIGASRFALRRDDLPTTCPWCGPNRRPRAAAAWAPPSDRDDGYVNANLPR
jgi:hypothetical protein